jgi:hypothetical protein
MSYKGLISYLKSLKEGNQWYRRLLEQKAEGSLLHSHLYQEYLDSHEISREALEGYLRLYENYGVCGVQRLKGLLAAQVYVTAKQLVLNARTLKSRFILSGELLVRVYSEIAQESPQIFAPKFNFEHVLLAYGSSVVWGLRGGKHFLVTFRPEGVG